MSRVNLCSTLSRRRRARPARDPMAEYDRLPAALRRWLAEAALPWSPRSAHRAWSRAMADLHCPQQALIYLDTLQSARLRRDRMAGDRPAQG